MTALPSLKEADCDGRIVLIPTAHVSPESADRVHRTIDAVRPDTVAIELDEDRAQRYADDTTPTLIRLSDLIDERASLCGTGIAILHRAGTLAALEKLNSTMEDTDMLTAMETAADLDIPCAYIDRNYAVTRERLVSECAPIELVPVVLALGIGYLTTKLSTSDADEFAERTRVTRERFAERSTSEAVARRVLGKLVATPTRVIRDERDEYMADRLDELKESSETIVTVIGAAHWQGITRELRQRGYKPITVWPAEE